MQLSPDELALLREIAAEKVRSGNWMPERVFVRSGGNERKRALESLATNGLVHKPLGALVPTLQGLQAVLDPWVPAFLEQGRQVWAALSVLYNAGADHVALPELLAKVPTIPADELARILAVLVGEGPFALGGNGQRIASVSFPPNFNELEPVFSQSEGAGFVESWRGDARALTLCRIHLAGYGPLVGDELSLAGMRLLVGTNAAGKSTISSALSLLANLTDEALALTVDRARPYCDAFRKGSDGIIEIRAEFAVAGTDSRLEYQLRILGPSGAAKIVSDSVNFGGSPLMMREGERLRGPMLQKVGNGPIQQNDSLLRRVLVARNPLLRSMAENIRSWRFYSRFDLSPQSPLRAPGAAEAEPTLDPLGHNLMTVLVDLWTRLRDSHWPLIESALFAAVPGFVSLKVEPFGPKGHFRAVWHEEAFDAPLALADLSDGTLQLLALACACLVPGRARLLVFDEPEAGLHPRAVHVAASLLRHAAERVPVLVLTHSPQLIRCFTVDEISVVRREYGGARIVEPGKSAALRGILADLGDDGLAQTFLTEELEQLP